MLFGFRAHRIGLNLKGLGAAHARIYFPHLGDSRAFRRVRKRTRASALRQGLINALTGKVEPRTLVLFRLSIGTNVPIGTGK